MMHSLSCPTTWVLCMAMLSSHLLLLPSKCFAQSTTASTSSDSIMEVSFPSTDGTLQLQGTLRLPCFDCTNTPGVVLIHGSGPHSRDEVLTLSYGFSIPVFQEIATSLVQEHGIAVLTYDKRTCGAYNECSSTNQYPLPNSANLTMEDFLADAAAAVEFLHARPQVGPIVVIGHSQGGSLVPLLLTQQQLSAFELAGGVMLAGPYHGMDSLLQDQYEFAFETLLQQGFNETTATASLLPVATMIEGVLAVKQNSTVEEDLVVETTGASAAFWNSWFDITQRALDAAAAMDQPLLLINGRHDTNVFPSEAEAWEAHLKEVGATYQLEMLPCITHALNCVNATYLFNATEEQSGRHVDPGVIASIARFVQEVTTEEDGELPSKPTGDDGSSDTSTATAADSTSTSSGAWIGSVSSIFSMVVMSLILLASVA